MADKAQLAIQYDRSGRRYVWTDPESGEMFTFPSGAQGKAAAWRFAVSMLDPELFGMAQRIIARHPQLERVTWRGVELVLNGHVEIMPGAPDGVVALVESSDHYGRHHIRQDDGYFTCTCEHFTSHEAPLTTAGARYCKHLIATRIALMREERF
jgi:hypothetical protein